MKFATLASCFERLQATTSRIEMTALLARLLGGAAPDEIGLVCYFVLGEIGPGYKRVSLNIGDRAAAAAIALAAGTDLSAVEAAVREFGDYGDVAYHLIEAPAAESLSVTDVHRSLSAIAGASGPGSAEEKKSILARLLAAATPVERRYLVRLATGNMRLGAGDMTLLDALAEAFLGSRAERRALEHAYNISSDIGLVARTLREGGLPAVQAITITLHRPIRPMLTQRVARISEILERIGSPVIAVEEKYDGERIQAHKDGNDVTLFSRRLTDVTDQYPDIARHIRRCVAADTAILDGEAVAFDHETGTYRPFQALMRRRRKYQISEVAAEIPATYRVFDLLYVNGESYLHRSYPDRRAKLEEILSRDDHLSPADRIITDNTDGITEFYLACIERGLEGIVCKSCADDSFYRAGAREWQWIKWKSDYAPGLSDTLDLVIVGANAGRGKRAGTYGSVLCAAYNSEKDVFQTVCGMGTGFSDPDLADLPRRLAGARADRQPARVMANPQAAPDFWFLPAQVVEVLGLEITESPIHTCNWDPVRRRGLALRFPRFVRWRDEKSPEQATTTAEVAAIFHRQREV
ncbi:MULTISPECIES: ATP-dependent DNA ligase [Methanoculleus]|uniref:DNA ligase n=1 Tax=Methanoculleus thermophilus TaxID=2200 RepID=A0A1G8XUM3_9EURY|nr:MULTISPECIES: ATP-dependent DNA ligase [Methanoculleus]NLN08425.1 ATP-dependent DNA ligase [Methanoculleus thermophilus]SDJ94187.1 DNA ligase-1 [Methanoculleus thermophilus]HQD25186.1 ATP-dependent DNA ligase [Methanoculleus thermophilus]